MGDYTRWATIPKFVAPKFADLKKELNDFFGGINREEDMRWPRERRELEENRARVDPEAVQSLMRRFFSFGH